MSARQRHLTMRISYNLLALPSMPALVLNLKLERITAERNLSETVCQIASSQSSTAHTTHPKRFAPWLSMGMASTAAIFSSGTITTTVVWIICH